MGRTAAALGIAAGRLGRLSALALALAGAPAMAAAATADYPLDGNWEGKGYTSGSDECPSFDVYISVAGHHAEGRFLEAGRHKVELSFDVDASGKFSKTFQTFSGHNVRISGKVKGNRWQGNLHHYVCRGTWYAERTAAPAPAQAAAPAAGAGQPQGGEAELGLVEQLKLLQDLRQRGLVDEPAYERRRAALLDQILKDSAADGGAGPAASEAKAADVQAALDASGIEFGRYHALIIANNNYRHFPKLITAIPDGLAVARMLRDHYGFLVELLIDAERYDIISALTRLRGKLRHGDNLLIYYAGHGVLDEAAEQGYWVPVDGEPDNPANWVANSDITTSIRAMRAKHIVLVVDSCYSGTLIRGAESELPSSLSREAWLRRMIRKTARTVMTSGGLEPVVDSGGGGHSVFAKAFLDVLRENREILDGQTLFSKLKRFVVVNAAQTPEYSDLRFTGHDGGDFLFVRR